MGTQEKLSSLLQQLSIVSKGAVVHHIEQLNLRKKFKRKDINPTAEHNSYLAWN
jgi:hypothetical protein